jgi:hypothetical protein
MFLYLKNRSYRNVHGSILLHEVHIQCVSTWWFFGAGEGGSLSVRSKGKELSSFTIYNYHLSSFGTYGCCYRKLELSGHQNVLGIGKFKLIIFIIIFIISPGVVVSISLSHSMIGQIFISFDWIFQILVVQS